MHFLTNAYFVDRDEIYASDFAVTDRDFVVDRFGTRSALQFSLVKLKKIFADHNITVESKHPVITVYKMAELDLEALKNAVHAEFANAYEQMNIVAISIIPQSFIDIKNLELISVDIAPNAIKKSKGNFQAWYGKDGKAIKRIFFGFEIEANLAVFVTRGLINGGAIIDKSSVEEKIIAFENLADMPISPDQLGKITAKGRIAKGDIITNNRTNTLPDLIKNSTIKVELISSGVKLSFFGVVQKNAQVGELVDVKDTNGKLFRVRVISKDLAKVE